MERVPPETTIDELLDQIRSLHLALAIWTAYAKQLEQERNTLRERLEDTFENEPARGPDEGSIWLGEATDE